jgi:hypothetical protein
MFGIDIWKAELTSLCRQAARVMVSECNLYMDIMSSSENPTLSKSLRHKRLHGGINRVEFSHDGVVPHCYVPRK